MEFSEKVLARKGIDRNLKLMVIEVIKQVEDTQKVFENPIEAMVSKIDARDDYIDNLKNAIENKCYNHPINQNVDKKALDLIRAVNVIGTNLERVADYAVSIVNQIGYLDDPRFTRRFKLKSFFDEALKALGLILKALTAQDIELALKICRAEFNIDSHFEKNLRRIIHDLEQGEETGNFVTMIFVINYLERLGDAILNIGEAIIFAILGEKLKIHDFEELEDTMATRNMKGPVTDLSIESFWETKSGCRIRRIREKSQNGSESRVVFKEGRANKLEKERESILAWEAIKPGLPPKVYGLTKSGKMASLLLEYLDGQTIQQLLLSAKTDRLKETLSATKKTLLEVWGQTLDKKETSANFIKQIHSRIKDILKAHPGFELLEKQIGNQSTASLKKLLDEAGAIEKKLKAPFSVRIHGDFNIDNVIYNRQAKQIHFIDLYRSGKQDYVQDLSVFLISNFRQPIFDEAIRKRVNHTIADFFQFGKIFARKNQDPTFEARLALGVTRSLFTSTRFEIHDDFAESMLLRAVYLLEKIVHHESADFADFKFPETVLYYN